MQELLEIYDLEGNFLGIQDRKEFYEETRKEYAEKGKISRKIKTARILIMNSEGRIYLQKRSNLKQDNSGLYDKTVGGHIRKGESLIIGVVRECAEELGFPVVIISQEEFKDAISSVDLSVVGVLKELSEDQNFLSERKMRDGNFIQPYISHFYIGYYDGSIKFKDGESSGLETFSLEELLEEFKRFPEKFTKDLDFMIKKFGADLKAIK